jgi:hypothetical protein
VERIVRSNIAVHIEGVEAEEVVAEGYEKGRGEKRFAYALFRVHPSVG